MRTVYATVLGVRADSDISSALDYIGRWIQDWYKRQRLKVDVFENLAEGDISVAPAEGHQLRIKHFTAKSAPNTKLVDIHWEYPDQYDNSLGWVIRIALFRSPTGVLLSFDLAVTGLKLFFAPASIKLGSPRVIRDIARLRSVVLGSYPYNVTPEVVHADEVEELVGELTDMARPFPIVLVSRRLEDDQPLIDVNEVAERLAGIAKIYELADKWSGFCLTEEISKPLSCFGGAVRLYWPRFTKTSDPFQHPAWMPWQFKDSATSGRSLYEMSSRVFDAAALRHVEPAVITHARNLAEREFREEARQGGNKGIEELLEDQIALEAKLLAIQEANELLTSENETLRANAMALAALAAWNPSNVDSLSKSSEPEAVSEPSSLGSIAEAVSAATARAKHLKFLPSAAESAVASPYRHPDRVFEALAALEEVASIWAETVESGKSAGSIRQLFKKRGFEYADDISQTSKGKFGNEYVADYQGRQLDISPHITIGAKQADTCLSIHWAWDKDERVAIVAHVGRHKSNTKT